MSNLILALDQGTTSSRSMLFNQNFNVCGQSQKEFTQHFPESGWVEHEPADLLATVKSTCAEALKKASVKADDIAAIGITNQRETTVIWDANTGAPLHNAIVWQDRRTAKMCESLRAAGHSDQVTDRTDKNKKMPDTVGVIKSIHLVE